jgi:acyl carrier protein
MDSLELEIKQLIVSALDLEDFDPEDIITDSPLFNDGLGLDSIDALELGIAIKKKYNVSFSAEDSENRKYFASVAALASFIRSNVSAQSSVKE